MGALQTIAAVVLTISLLVFVALFGRLPIFRRTPVAFVQRLLFKHLPNGLGRLDERVTGRRVSRGLQRTGDYLMNEAHPFVLIFFVLLQVVGEALFIPAAWGRLDTTNKTAIPFLVAAPLVFLWLSTTTTSNVTPANHRAAMLAYPYDFALFHPGYFCRTCRHAKPARSKHCPICRACVQKQDHHCVWINNCVGRNNYVWFCLLLVSIAGLLAYGTVTGHRLLDARLQDRFVPPALTRGSRTGKRWSTRLGWAEYVHCWAWAVSVEWPIGAVTLLATMSFPLALGFLTYHLYLCWAGMTTNESAKWSDWKEDIADGLVFRARISDLRTTYPPLPPDVEPPDAAVHWPAGVRAKYWLVRMNEPGRRPTIQTEGVVDGRGDGEARPEDPTTPESPGRSVPDQRPDPRWTPVTTLAEVENVYDLGFGANLVDSLFNRG